jgi:hypothetical protein
MRWEVLLSGSGAGETGSKVNFSIIYTLEVFASYHPATGSGMYLAGGLDQLQNRICHKN